MLNIIKKSLFNRSTLRTVSDLTLDQQWIFWCCQTLILSDCVLNFLYRRPICSTASLTSAELMETQEGYLSFPTVWNKNCIFTSQNMYKSPIKIISEGLLWILPQTNTHALAENLQLGESHANLMMLLRHSDKVWDTYLNQAVVDCLVTPCSLLIHP